VLWVRDAGTMAVKVDPVFNQKKRAHGIYISNGTGQCEGQAV
jgi:hypothetical protein